MERKIYHGKLSPVEIAEALLAEFNRGNLRAQIVGSPQDLAVQIATRMGATSGGQTALTVHVKKVADGIMVELGQQAWLGVAASLGQTAFWLLRNPFNLIGRLDDLAQDIENLQLQERIWHAVAREVAAAGMSHQLSERLSKLVCAYCGTTNPLEERACLACGAPFGEVYPTTCPHCGFALKANERVCPHCNKAVPPQESKSRN